MMVDHILFPTFQKEADFWLCAGVAKEDAAFAFQGLFGFVEKRLEACDCV